MYIKLGEPQDVVSMGPCRKQEIALRRLAPRLKGRKTLLALRLYLPLYFDDLKGFGVDPNAPDEKSFPHFMRIRFHMRRNVDGEYEAVAQHLRAHESQSILALFSYVYAQQLRASQKIGRASCRERV